MSTHDYVIDNASGATVRSDINNALSAIVTHNSNSSAPSTTYADMFWVDTTNGQIKRRNSANSGWIPFGPRSSTMVQAKTSVYTVAATDFATVIDCTSGTFSLNLTAAATLGDGFMFFARNSGTGTITLDPNSSETIDGATTFILAPGESVTAWCNGSAWKTIGNYKTKPCFKAHRNGTDQSIPAATETRILFTAEEFDVGGFYDGSARFAPPAGKYRITATMNLTGANASDGGQHYAALYKNGTLAVSGPVIRAGAASGVGVFVSSLFDLSGTDSIDAFVYADGGGTRTVGGNIVSTYFCGEQI